MAATDLEAALSDYRARLVGEGMRPRTIDAYMRALKECLAEVPELLAADESRSRALTEGYLSARGPAYDSFSAQASLRKWHGMRFGVAIGRRRDSIEDFRGGPDIDSEVSALRSHLEARGLAPATIDATCSAAAMFLGWRFPDGPVELPRVDGFAVIDFLAQGKSRLGIGSKKTVATRLKRYPGFVDERLGRQHAALAINPPNWGNAPLPRSLDDAEYEALTAYDGTVRSAVVAAAAALMGNLGLRCCEAANLAIGDIDFPNASVLVRATKGAADRRLPLDGETGEALARYIMDARPKGASDRLFVRSGSHGGEAMTESQLRGLMRYHARTVGIPDFGTHMLRRRSATRMVQAGVPIKVVADVMGHREVQTTKGYLRVDIDHLRTAAGDWPGAANG